MNEESFKKIQEGLNQLSNDFEKIANDIDKKGTKLRGVTAEACMLSKSASDIVQYNSLIRDRFSRALAELKELNTFLRVMEAAMISYVEESTKP